jgi:Ca-activated chloride channel homolog
MGRRHPEVVTGALMFIRESRPDDDMFVVNFNDKVELGLPPDRPYSNNFNDLRTALLSGEVGGHTALYDAIWIALDHLDKAGLKKKVLLIVSDGADNRSTHSLDEISKRAGKAGVLMYTVGLFDATSEDKNPGVLRRLARESGGLAYLPEDLASLSGICTQIAKDIRVQYTIGYSSSKASSDAAFHQLKLSAVDSRGRQLQVRTRAGFYGGKAAAETKEK